jgi:hypothetical protein
MKPNAFVGRKAQPTDKDVAEALGAAKSHWDAVVKDMAREMGLAEEWKSYGPKQGWALRLKRGKRNIVHLGPCQGCFRVACILGDRAVKAARASHLGRTAEKLLDAAPRYPEGTGIRLEVAGPKLLPLIRKLAQIKLDN